MAEVTGDDNREGTGNSPARADRHTLPGVTGPRARSHERALRTLSPAECLGLLEAGGIGRVGFASADGIRCCRSTSPSGKAIIFRTAPDTLLAVYADGQVSFEADHLDQAHRDGWTSWCRVTRTRSPMSVK